jgi:hypothetical protein
VWPAKKKIKLSSRFSDEFSFALFAEGLRAFSGYQKWHHVDNLRTAVTTFEQAVRDFPQDRIHYYYLGLIRLEQASALPELGPPPPQGDGDDAGAAVQAYKQRSDVWSQTRVALTTLAIKDFEKYQRDRHTGDDLWLYFWADYNRAACYVHQLQPDGYLCARGILSKYMDEVIHIPIQIPDRQDLRHIPMDVVDAGARLLAGKLPQPSSIFEGGWRFLAVGLFHPDYFKKGSQMVTAGDGESFQATLGNLPSARQTFFLGVKSLFLLTRVRPLREPLSLQSREYLGLEPIEAVRQDVVSLSQRIVAAQTEGPKKERISADTTAELESDLLNQLGHLDCARALNAFPEHDRRGAAAEAQFRGGNNFTVFSELMHDDRFDHNAQSEARDFLQHAANSFEESLAKQPGWIPALRNLCEAFLLLGRDADALKIQLPVLVPAALEIPPKTKPPLDPTLTWLTTYTD